MLLSSDKELFRWTYLLKKTPWRTKVLISPVWNKILKIWDTFFEGIPGKWVLGPGTCDHGPLCGTRDPGSSIWEPSPGTGDPGPIGGNRDPGPLCETCELGPSTWVPSPGTWDPICANQDPIPLRETRDPYLGTLTLIQLSLNVQFSSVA